MGKGNLSDFQKRQIAGASVTITAQLFGVSRTTVLTVMGTQSMARHHQRRKTIEHSEGFCPNNTELLQQNFTKPANIQERAAMTKTLITQNNAKM
uniref:Uncharacterized protein n=1 Tax=Sinocyclocheilus anshuiensis TaxID=1608454 RepID=A0A671RL01_9TELE